MAKIGLMATSDLTERNMEHILFRITGILAAGGHHIDLLGVHSASDRIRDAYHIYPAGPQSWLWPGPVLSRIRQVRAYIRRENPDLVMAISSIGVNGLAVTMAARLEKKPSIVRLTSDVFRVWRTHETRRGRISLYVRNNIFGRIAMFLANKTVLLHQAQYEELASLGFKKERLYVVPQPVTFPDGINLADLRQKIRDGLGLSDDHYLVASMFRLDANKKIALLEETIENTLARDPSAHFLIIGKGNRREAMVRRFQREPRVTFIDQLPRDDLAGYYCACDAVLHMSDSEGLSNVMIEALYFDKPVIATDSGAITRAITPNIVNDADGFARMIHGRAARTSPLPDTLAPDRNRALWLALVEETLRNGE